MAIEYTTYEDNEGTHRRWVNEFGVTQMELVTPSEAFIKAHERTWETTGAREIRNAFLAATDWTISADSPLTSDQRSEATEFRQKIRDLPKDYPNAEDARTALDELRPENTLSFLK